MSSGEYADREARRIETARNRRIPKYRASRPKERVFGAVLGELVLENNLEYKELAERSGVSDSSISKIIKGEIEPSNRIKKKLLIGLYKPYLLDETEQERYLQKIAERNGCTSYENLCANSQAKEENSYEKWKTAASERASRPLNSVLSTILQYAVQKEGFSKKEISVFTGKSYSLVNQWFQGVSLPKEEDAEVLFMALGLDDLVLDEPVLEAYSKEEAERLGYDSLHEYLTAREMRSKEKRDDIAQRLGYDSYEALEEARKK